MNMNDPIKALRNLIASPGLNQPYSTALIEADPAIETEIAAKLRVLAIATASSHVPPPAEQEDIPLPSELHRFALTVASSWSDHNRYCDVVDALLLHSSTLTDTRSKFAILVPAYTRMLSLDRRNRQLSVRIKPRLQTHLLGNAQAAYPAPALPALSFWTRYPLDHLAHTEGRISEEKLAARYHRGSPAILRYRLMHDPLLSSQAMDRVRRLEPSNYHQDPDLSDPVATLLYIDNYCEPLWIKALVGIPDYYLRREIARLIEVELSVQVNCFDADSIAYFLSRLGVLVG